MRIIISPAKKMKDDPDSLDWKALPAFLGRTEELKTRLQSMSFGELKRLWKCNDQLAELNVQRLQTMDLRRHLTPAILSYEGIQYQNLAPQVMTMEQLDYLQEHLRILSGLYGVVRPLAETRPAWKVLRVLGNVLNLNGFDYETSEAIRDEALAGDIATRLSNALAANLEVKPQAAQGLVRLGEVPIYQLDAMTRRAPSLQATADATAPKLRANATTLASLGLSSSTDATVAQGSGESILQTELDADLADGVIRVAAHSLTTGLGALFAPVTVNRA